MGKLKVGSREVTWGRDKEKTPKDLTGQRFDYYDEQIKQPLEVKAGLVSVHKASNLRDCANHELTAIESKLRSLEIRETIVNRKIQAKKAENLTKEDEDTLVEINEQKTLLLHYKALLFRAPFIGARDIVAFQKKLKALAYLFWGWYDMKSYRDKLHKYIDRVYVISWGRKEGEPAPPILYQGATIFPLKSRSGAALDDTPDPNASKEKESETY